MQFGKFHSCSKCLLIPFHSATDEGALTYFGWSTAHMASQVSFKIKQTVDHPIQKLNDIETYLYNYKHNIANRKKN